MSWLKQKQQASALPKLHPRKLKTSLRTPWWGFCSHQAQTSFRHLRFPLTDSSLAQLWRPRPQSLTLPLVHSSSPEGPNPSPWQGWSRVQQAADHDLSLGTELTSSCGNRDRRDVGKIYYLYDNLNYQIFKILFRYWRTASQLPSECAGLKFQVGKIHMYCRSLDLGRQFEHWLAGRNIYHPPNYSWSSNTLKVTSAFLSAERSTLKALKDPNLFISLEEKPNPLFSNQFSFQSEKNNPDLLQPSKPGTLLPILGWVVWCLLHSVLEFCTISKIYSWKVIVLTEMWMTEFHSPVPNKLEPHLAMMLNFQTQWAVPPEEPERSNKSRDFSGSKIYHLNTVRTQPHLTTDCPHKLFQSRTSCTVYKEKSWVT